MAKGPKQLTFISIFQNKAFVFVLQFGYKIIPQEHELARHPAQTIETFLMTEQHYIN